MQNLGEGGEAKASLADRDDADTMQPDSATGGVPTVRGEESVDQSGRGGSLAVGDGLIGTASPRLGYGQTAAYGETIENAPAPTEPTTNDEVTADG